MENTMVLSPQDMANTTDVSPQELVEPKDISPQEVVKDDHSSSEEDDLEKDSNMIGEDESECGDVDIIAEETNAIPGKPACVELEANISGIENVAFEDYDFKVDLETDSQESLDLCKRPTLIYIPSKVSSEDYGLDDGIVEQVTPEGLTRISVIDEALGLFQLFCKENESASSNGSSDSLNLSNTFYSVVTFLKN